jgi:hypothetical protein
VSKWYQKKSPQQATNEKLGLYLSGKLLEEPALWENSD